MRRLAVLALVAVAACNAILGIEPGAVDPVAPLEAGTSVDGSTTEPRADADPPVYPVDAAATEGPPDAGPCENTETNPRHCGKCGFDCGPGACDKGKCEPGVVVTDEDGPGPYVVTATHVIYSTAAAALRRVPIYGGNPETLVPSTAVDGFGARLVVIGEHVYFPDRPNNRVARCPLTGPCTPETIIGDFARAYSLVTVNGDLFAADGPGGARIVRCNAPPCAMVNVFSLRLGIGNLTATADAVAWTTVQNERVQIYVQSVAGGSSAELFDQPDAGILPVTALAGRLDTVYAIFQGNLLGLKPGTTPFFHGKTGASTSLAFAGSDFLYTSDDIYRRSRLASPNAAPQLDIDTEAARHLVVHETGTYWVSKTRIMRLVR